MNKKDFSLKWSLRGMLLMVTLLSAMLAWKYGQRNRILSATKQVRLAGGEVIYRFQNPKVATKTAAFISAYSAKPVPVTRTLSDGSTVTETVTRSYMGGLRFPLAVNDLRISGHSKSGNPILGFLNNSDILIDAVRIPELNVDRELIAALQDLDGLRIVQVCRSRQYFRTMVSSPGTHQVTAEQKRIKLAERSKPFESAKSIIQHQLPHLQIIDGVLE